MTSFLIKLFIRDYQNTENASVRSKYGILSGFVGIVTNIILTAIKLIIGSATGSISITADALNNLSDAGSSGMSLLGFKLSAKPADEEHPYGHGRLEYICGMGISVVILFMGYELIKSSVEKIIHPEAITFSWISVIVLAVSITGKIWLALFNAGIGKRINSGTVDAVVKDSVSDIAATTATIAALILSRYSTLPFDGIFGVLVAGFVFYAGIGVLKDTVSPLLGQPPTPETVKAIEDKILSYDGIVGVHDLIVHDYGPSRCFVSAHAEVPANTDIMISHDLIDVIERDITAQMGYMITLHMDPIVTDDETTTAMRERISEMVTGINPGLSIHDFRMVSGPHHTNLIFDLVIPFSVKLDNETVIKQINEQLEKFDEEYYAVITVDRSYT